MGKFTKQITVRRADPRAALIIAALVLVLTFIPKVVLAAECTVYPTEDACVSAHNNDGNYEGWNVGYLCDEGETGNNDAGRIFVKVPYQAGTFSNVELWIHRTDVETYSEEHWLMLYACRVTKTIDFDYLTWDMRDETHAWTTGGGDYTNTYRAEQYADLTGGDEWIPFTITDMANYEFAHGDDLYVVIRFRYENISPEDYTFMDICMSEGSEPPEVHFTYSGSPPAPATTIAASELTYNNVTLTGTPTLNCWPTINMQGQLSLHDAGNWTITSGNQTRTTPTQVSINDWSETLAGDTAYDGRICMYYDTNSTAYSANVTFTTIAWDMPTWGRNATDVNIYDAIVEASYTGNNDSKTIYSRIAYANCLNPTGFYYTAWESDTAVNASNSWNITGLYEGCDYTYKSQYLIDTILYESTTAIFHTYFGIIMDYSIVEYDVDYVTINVEYDTSECLADPAWIKCRVGKDQSPLSPEWGEWSETIEGLTEPGSHNFTFEGLDADALYWIEAEGSCAGTTTILADLSTYTESIDTLPVVGDVLTSFTAPNTLTLGLPVTLNDVETYPCTVYFYYEPVAYKDPTIMPYTYMTAAANVTGDGTISVDLICGPTGDLAWDTDYYVYGVLDYTVGTLASNYTSFSVPIEPFAIGTNPATMLTSTSYILNGWVQNPGIDTQVRFYYWIDGSTNKIATQWQGSNASGTFTWQIDNFAYGTQYCYQAHASYGNTLGNIECFRAGYATPEPGDGGGLPGLPTYSDIWGFVQSTAGHWLIMLVAMGIGALIFYRRHKYVALIICLMVLGLGIVIGWIDPWIIVLLAIGGGITLWRMIAGSRQPG